MTQPGPPATASLRGVRYPLGLLVVIYLVPLAFAQDEMTHIPTDGFSKMQRAQVAFAHDAHNEKAELDDCVICHHSKTDDGKQDLENSSEGETCESCHAEKRDDGGTPLTPATRQVGLHFKNHFNDGNTIACRACSQHWRIDAPAAVIVD